MSVQKTFKVGDRLFDAVQPSAVLQDELLGLLSTKIYVAFQVAAKGGTELGVKECAFMLMTIPVETKRRMVDILTERVYVSGTKGEVAVSAKDFQGKMVEWNTLLAELLIWNLSDFFAYLSDDLKEGRRAKPKKAAKSAKAE
nr:MAG TPA: tail assembly chaperone protein [Caudoviricetes sp.]